MPVLYANNAASTLAYAINSSAVFITIGNWANSRFPSIAAGSGDFFFATIEDGSTREIVKVTDTNSGTNTLTVTRGQDGTTAQSWPAGTAIELRITAASLNEIRSTPPKIQHFFSPGTSTWIKPDGAALVRVQMWAGGGGGGSGRRRSAASQSTAAWGGSGGSSGAYKDFLVDANGIDSSVNVVVGQGGSGGAAVTEDQQNGAAGDYGGDSRFYVSAYDYISVFGGPGGHGGLTTSPGQPWPSVGGMTFGSPTFGTQEGRGASGQDSSGTGWGQDHYFSGGGGGSGGGYAANNTTGRVGGGGGKGSNGAIGFAGGNGGFNGSNGNNGIGATPSPPTTYNPQVHRFPGGGGGGGGSSIPLTSGQPASAPSGSGGNGGWPAGAGGGGAACQGNNSGAGGNGAGGYVRITTFF